MGKKEFKKIPTCVLKVYIHCGGCKDEVEKTLKKINGVYEVSIDSELGKVTVLANVDPAVLSEKLAELGKDAKLWGAPEANKNNQNNLANQLENMQLPNGEGGISTQSSSLSSLQTCVLKVYIHCGGCKGEVEKTLKKINGVYEVSIDSELGKVTVLANVDPAVLIEKLAELGKDAKLWGAPEANKNNQNNLANQFENMQLPNGEGGISTQSSSLSSLQTCVLKVYIHCGGCKGEVEKTLKKINGVYEVSIDSELGKVTVLANVDPAVLIEKLAELGKDAKLWGAPEAIKNNQNHLGNQFENMQLGNGKGGNNSSNNNNQPKGGQPTPQQLQPQQTVERFIENMDKEKPTRFSAQLLENFTSNYSSELGKGGHGAVYEGHFPNGKQIAVKVLNNNGRCKSVDDQFMAEVNTIGRTYHRNLVRLYGFCFEGKTKALVYEYMENGSLDKLLFEKKHRIEWEKLYEIAVGAARGLEYLHHFSHKRIIHYDIKPANVLLDSNFCPKIADFGLAKLCDKDNTIVTLSGFKGTPGYAAPELWMPFPVSDKCDVYSFGVMLFEIIGRRRNVNTNLNESREWFPLQVWKKFDRGELEDVLENCEIQEEDMVKAKTMVTVALWCVQYLPKDRPCMRKVVKILEGEAEVASPPSPFQHLISSAKLPSCIASSSNSTIDFFSSTFGP